MVTCGNCGVENPAGYSFCSNCGTALAKVCPTCGIENASSNRFCFNCGANLTSETPSPADSAQPPTPASDPGERRLVSVLFADLVSYTTLSESTDPEDIRSMLTTFYDRCREIIARFGGVTDKFIGDAVMGVWGAVEAHEDDAERATRAALELVDMVAGLGSELGIGNLAARAGVLSGEASVGSGGNEHGLVVGDLVNTASRLQSIAPAGKVYVGEATRDLVGSSIEFTSAGTHELKGKSEPVDAFEAVRVLALSLVRRGGDLAEGPFVGRDDELRILKDQLHATGREGRARMVSVIGEAGIGKTRLSQELVRYIDGIAETIYYHSGRSPSYGDGVTFWALGEMIRERAGILEGEDPAKSRLKLRTTVAEYAPDEEEQRWIEPRLAAVIGLADMPSGQRSELYTALRTFFQRISERGTVLMVFEDLHWADEGLLDFIEDLVERTTHHPIVVIALARPELLDRRSDWGTKRRRSLLMHLSRLDDATMRRLVGGLAPGMPAELVNRIADRTAGVPLHAVEFVRMLLNGGVLVRDTDGYRLTQEPEELAIPDSVSAIIGARLDRLPHEETTLIQDASVLGLSFTLGGIASIRDVEPESLEPTLRDLVRSDILEVDEDPRSPERGQYRFVQSLIREVAYSRLSRAERVSRHLEIARAHEESGDVELAAVVAAHYASAVAADPGNDELVTRAKTAIVRAADRAASLHSTTQAAALYEQAMALSNDPAEVAPLRLEAGRALRASGRTDLAVDRGSEALEWYREVGDTEGVARAATLVASAYVDDFGSDKALEVILPVYEELPMTKDPAWADLARETCRIQALGNDTTAAVEVAERLLPVLEELDLVEAIGDTLISKATALAYVGRYHESVAILRGAIVLAQERDLLGTEVRATNNLIAITGSDIKDDPELWERGMSLIERLGNVGWQLRVMYFESIRRLESGDLAGARAMIAEAAEFDTSETVRDQFTMARHLLEMFATGPDPDGYAVIERVNAPYQQTGDPQGRANAVELGAFASIVNMEFAAAVDEVLSLRDIWSPWMIPAVVPGAIAAALCGDRERASELLAMMGEFSARGRYERGAVGFVRLVHEALSDDDDAARSEFESAYAAWLEGASQLDVAWLRACFSTLMPNDEPTAIRAGAEARRFFEDHGILGCSNLFPDLPSAGDAEADSVAV